MNTFAELRLPCCWCPELVQSRHHHLTDVGSCHEAIFHFCFAWSTSCHIISKMGSASYSFQYFLFESSRFSPTKRRRWCRVDAIPHSRNDSITHAKSPRDLSNDVTLAVNTIWTSWSPKCPRFFCFCDSFYFREIACQLKTAIPNPPPLFEIYRIDQTNSLIHSPPASNAMAIV